MSLEERAGKRGPEECPIVAVILQTAGQSTSLFGAVDERCVGRKPDRR